MKTKNLSELAQPLPATHQLSPRVYYKLGEVHSLSLHCYFHCCVFDLTKSSALVKASIDTVPLAHVGLWARYGAKEGSWKQSFRKHRGCQITAFLKLICVTLWASALDLSSLRLLSTTWTSVWLWQYRNISSSYCCANVEKSILCRNCRKLMGPLPWAYCLSV